MSGIKKYAGHIIIGMQLTTIRRENCFVSMVFLFWSVFEWSAVKLFHGTHIYMVNDGKNTNNRN